MLKTAKGDSLQKEKVRTQVKTSFSTFQQI